MRYLEKAIKFLMKNYLIAIPLFVAIALPALIRGAATVSVLPQITDAVFKQRPELLMEDPFSFVPMFTGVFAAAAGAGFIGWILKFIAEPATAGMVNKGLEQGSSDLNDFMPSLSKLFPKYVVFWLGMIAVNLAIGLAALIVLLLFGLLIMLLKGFGVFLFILGMIALAVAGIIVAILLSLWFPAMVVDDMGLVDAAKKSIAVVKENFWTIFGVTVLVNIGGAVVGAILSFLGFIPFIGTILLSVIPTATGILLTVFYFMVYRDKTRKVVA